MPSPNARTSVRAYGTAENPDAYGQTVTHKVFPNILPHKVGKPAAFGLAGGNGRSLTDNTPDVLFRPDRQHPGTPVAVAGGKDSVTAKPL